MDFTNKYFTISIPEINYCVEYALPFDINLKETMKELHDPKGNMTKYMGISTLPYANSTYYQFQVTQTNQASGELVIQNCFFDVNTNRLKYVMVEG